ncbi:hypothetical protein AVEN_55281-1 [Araneus ventricosus]|uniref:Uncharacterized protein n=1 Tax=Araneus ventricosus TaxID=182803 RepID=A0A4Y2D6Y1_ARAVE|nr:hypothetical protein AVEN_55281-1 [Araneus ventricosus]
MGMEVDKNDIDELVEEHSQDPITEDLKEFFHCVSQQEVVEVTAEFVREGGVPPQVLLCCLIVTGVVALGGMGDVGLEFLLLAGSPKA